MYGLTQQMFPCRIMLSLKLLFVISKKKSTESSGTFKIVCYLSLSSYIAKKKIRHYYRVVESRVTYESETFRCLYKCVRNERKIIRNIVEPQHSHDGYRLQTIEIRRVSDIEKRPMKFFEQLDRLRVSESK